MSKNTKTTKKIARARRTHAKAKCSGLPRLLVRKSNISIYAEVIDDNQGKVLVGANSLKSKKTGVAGAKEVGENIAKLAKEKKVEKVSFDRNGYKYHGQIKSLADAARKAGLEF